MFYRPISHTNKRRSHFGRQNRRLFRHLSANSVGRCKHFKARVLLLNIALKYTLCHGVWDLAGGHRAAAFSCGHSNKHRIPQRVHLTHYIFIYFPKINSVEPSVQCQPEAPNIYREARVRGREVLFRVRGRRGDAATSGKQDVTHPSILYQVTPRGTCVC